MPPVSRGFTLFELIIVIVVLGILSAAVMTAIGAQTQYEVNTRADELRRHLSHAQWLAASRAVRVRLSANSGGYSFGTCADPACSTLTPLTDPATGEAFAVTLPSGITLAPSSTLDFDSLGRPVSGTALIASVPARRYTLSAEGRSAAISVLPITGFARLDD